MSVAGRTPCVSLVLAALALACVAGARDTFAADPVIRVGPGTRAPDLANLPPTQVLEFPKGTRFTVAQVRSLAPLAARMRAVTGRGPLRVPLTGPVLPVTGQTARSRLDTAPDATVLQLPDGRKMTAGQFKAVVPNLPAASLRRAPATVKVARGTPLAELLKRPDSDVLESPNGKKTTVGELRKLVQSLPPAIRTR